MRYEDASQAGSIENHATPVARADADALSPGSMGPASGNVITGAGTITGLAGADTLGDAPTVVVSLQGAGGGSSGTGGTLQATGQFGVLSIDGQGGYNYVRNAGAPDGGKDVFTYAIADKDGDRSASTLTITLGKEEDEHKEASAAAAALNAGVVNLPAGVDLSDIRVVGRDLIVTLPDGSQMTIPGGAVFVPQLVIGDVEVPPTNVAALLIDSEPQPAAGPPQSSGGNFAVEVGPLDPGAPLGDLIPPTELTYIPPQFDDVGQFINHKPEIVIQPDGQPSAIAAIDSVDEAGLPARPVNEPAGTSAASPSETTTGTILYNSSDGPNGIAISVNGTTVQVTAVNQVIAGQYGNLTITSIADGAIGYSYTLRDNTSGNTTHDDFSVTVTDHDGDVATATLRIDIIDDVPTARADTDSIAAGAYGPETGNVITGVGTTSGAAGVDTQGADAAAISAVTGAGGTSSTFNASGNLVVNGQYGVLTLKADGSYSYVRNAGTAGGVNDVFTYTLRDGDADTSNATLTISIGDATPRTGTNATVLLDDDALANGNPGGVGDDADSANTSGLLVGAGGDGPLAWALQTSGAPAGFTYVAGSGGSVLVQQGGVTVLTVTINAGTGAYTVTQNAPIQHAAGSDENNQAFTINYAVTDQDGDGAPGTLSINVDDDSPTVARADISLPSLTVDETDLSTNASGNFSSVFVGRYGADGAGTTAYAVSAVNGTDSGLIDVATGQHIYLFNNAGVVEGHVGNSSAGALAFTVSVASGTGVVTLDQVRAVSHPNALNADDAVSPIGSTIQLTATITDRDGDPASSIVAIGGNLVFKDDGPSISASATQPALTVDETSLATNATASFASVFTSAFGADGAGAVTYALGITGGNGVASGLIDVATGSAIVLVLNGAVVEGHVGTAAGALAFTVAVDGSGNVTLDQIRAVQHPNAANPDDSVSLSADNLVTLSATVTDRDGDQASATASIGQNLMFKDDSPSISASATQPALTVDETSLATNATASFASVFTSAFGADGAGAVTYALGITGGNGVASGLIDVATGSAIVLVLNGSVVEGHVGTAAGALAFTVAVDGSGNVTLDQVRAVQHPNATNPDDSVTLANDNLVTLSATVTDRDGDQASATANIGQNLMFKDDGPSIGLSEGEATLTVDETNLATNATASFAAAFSPVFGADGAGTVTYALSVISAGANSGLIDVATGSAIVLVNNAGVVEGHVGTAAGALAFTVTVDGSGNVTLDQIRAVQHPNATNPDDSVSLSADNLVALTATVTDRDGDTATASLNIGSNLVFKDDGPSISLSGSEATLTVDETSLAINATASFAAAFSPVFGADGAGTVTYALSVISAGANSGLIDVATGSAIVLVLNGSVVEGHVGTAAGALAFTVAVDGSGNVTLDQIRAVQHPNAANPDDSVSLSADNLVALTATVTDRDGDTATASLNIGSNLMFKDDGPSISLSGSEATLTVDETSLAINATASFVGAFSPVFGADGAGTVTYALSVISAGANSGLIDVATGSAIVLVNNAGVVEGHVGTAAGALAFTVTVDGSGNVTLDQIRAVQHPNATNPDDSVSLSADNLVALTATVTDRDGDTATASLNIGSNLVFKDDGPSISLSGSEATLTVDETSLAINATASFAAAFSPVFGADGAGTVTYALSVISAGANSGLIDVATGSAIVLVNNAGVVEGHVGTAAGALAFTVTVDGSGNVTLDQIRAVQHPNATNPDDSVSLSADNLVALTATVTDRDGDTATASLNIGSNLVFKDDGPSINVTATADAGVLVQTQDGDTIGLATDTATSSANFGGVFGLTSSGGSDGAANVPALSYTLGVSAPGVDSGLDQTGANIYLYSIGGKVVGSTSVTQGGVTTGNTVFDVAVSGTGVVTLTQYSQIDHPIGTDPSATTAPFADHIVSLADGLVTLTATASITDNDGDVATDSETIGIGANLQFADHGPVATNDTDTIVGGNGPATGNVMTGVDIIGGDGNTTDGNADTVGADAPGSITKIQSVNVGANVDTSYDGSGNLVVNGQYGTLTINANGDYSYLRTTALGGVSDTFTYTLTDRDGDTATATLSIAIQDNFPAAGTVNVLLDDDALAGGNAGALAVGDDVDSQNASGTLPGSGGDGALSFSLALTGAPSGFTYVDGPGESILVQQGGITVLTVTITNTATGAYTVVQNAPIMHDTLNGFAGDNTENNQAFAITYNVTDADGDVAVPAGTININVDDDTPTINVTQGVETGVLVQTQDADTIGLATDTATSTANFGGVFGLTQSVGADGGAAASLSFTLGIASVGVDSGLDQGGANIYLYVIGGKVVGSTSATQGGVLAGNTVFDVGVSGTGVVTLTQYSQIDHPLVSDPTPSGTPFADHIVSMVDSLVTLTASATITDNDGDTASDSETINIGANLQFADDGPTAAVGTTGQTLTVDETAGLQANDVVGPLAVFAGVTNQGVDPNMAAQFATNANAIVNSAGTVFGADGAGTAVFSLNVSAAGVDSGLNTTDGHDILLFKEGNLIVGRVSGGTDDGKAAFALSIDSTGHVSMVEYLSIQHPNAANPDDSVSIANGAVLAVVTATDADGDTSTASTAIGSLVSFRDDGPTLGVIQNQQTDNNPATTPAVGTLHFVAGADDAGAAMTITANVAGIKSGGFTLVTQQSGNVLTAYQDTNGDGIHQIGESTAVFTITVNPSAGTSGQYVFDLMAPLTPTVTTVAIGGSSSFGSGPTVQGQVLDDSGGAHLAVVSGYIVGGTFNEATWLATGSVGATSNLTASGVNGSTAGWGVTNNNFEGTTEFFTWDFGSQPLANPDGAGGYVPPAGVTLPDISVATFEMIHYGAADDITYVVHFTDGTFDSGHIPAASMGAFWTYTAPAGKFLADIQMLASGAGSGKVDLSSVGVQNSTLDVTIPATVQLSDADGDLTTVGTFSIHVKTGLSPLAPSAPVVLDLNGDGVHFIATDAGVGYDYGSGLVATAWASASDGILVRDANGDGTVTNASEFVFGGNGVTDLQALAAQYGSTLDAGDAAFADFAVWQDANSNGVVDAGEFNSLLALGITSVSLSTDNQSYVAANGDVLVAGTGTFTWADGSVGTLADAAFTTSARTTTAEQLLAGTSATSNAALIAAIAAAGLEAAPAMAQPADSPLVLNEVANDLAAAGSGGLHNAIVSREIDHSVADQSNGTADQQASPADASSHTAPSTSGAEQGGLDTAARAESAPTELLAGTDAPASNEPAAVHADAMPSAEQLGGLVAKGIDLGQANHGSDGAGAHHAVADIGQVLADALAGGADHGPSIDAVLDAAAQINGGADGAGSESSPVLADAPMWHGDAGAGFTALHAALSMDAMATHPDAVQAAA